MVPGLVRLCYCARVSDELTMVVHDRGCRFARLPNGNHSEAAWRLHDRYNLHRAAGTHFGWIMARLTDGTADDDAVFPSRAEAVNHAHHNEGACAFVELRAPFMSVCEAASLLRMAAMARRIAPAQRDTAGGGLMVIPRLTLEDQARQLAALAGRVALPVALGRRE